MTHRTSMRGSGDMTNSDDITDALRDWSRAISEPDDLVRTVREAAGEIDRLRAALDVVRRSHCQCVTCREVRAALRAAGAGTIT
jgi:hypothetical protein